VKQANLDSLEKWPLKCRERDGQIKPSFNLNLDLIALGYVRKIKQSYEFFEYKARHYSEIV